MMVQDATANIVLAVLHCVKKPIWQLRLRRSKGYDLFCIYWIVHQAVRSKLGSFRMELVSVATFRSVLEREGFNEDTQEKILGCLFQASSVPGILRSTMTSTLAGVHETMHLGNEEVGTMSLEGDESQTLRHGADKEDESLGLQEVPGPESPANLLESLYQAGLEDLEKSK
jgi:hypothetical protein